jgi:cobalt-zinc-cadmium efflux system protein
LSAHVLVARDEDCHRIRRELEELLHERFGLDHTTLQVEHTSDRLLGITTLRTDRPDR